MTIAPSIPTDPLAELRVQVSRMEGRPAAQPVRTHPALDGLLQLQTGATYGVSSASVAALLMAGPSMDGAWCAVVGTAELGVEAAAMVGVDLDRVVVVPDPGDAWLEVVAALVDVLGVVVVRPPKSLPSPKDVARLAARLRTRGSILIVWGDDWPRCDARLGLTDVEWHGAGWGNGHLKARQATVEVRKGTGPGAQRRLWLPDVDLRVHPVQERTLRSVS
ncbi:MAG TPA: hypothetical protein VM093_10015 [Aeromicrobium sp.]|nr:hypothetical protein [Aeromicrobium sp.]